MISRIGKTIGKMTEVCIGITQVEQAHTLEEFLHVPPIGDGLAQLTRLCIEESTLVANT